MGSRKWGGCVPGQLNSRFKPLQHLPPFKPTPRTNLCKAKSMTRRERLKQATPPWADSAKTRKLQADAKFLTFSTGVPHTVDHTIPLEGKTVCGLHVHTNMRVMTGAEHRRKGNSFIDQVELFVQENT